jgi:cell wall-associated NlpC family hydrolase
MIKIVIKHISLPGMLILFLFSLAITNCSLYRHDKGIQEREKFVRAKVVDKARDLQGIKYRYAGKSPKGFDCSGFTGYVFKDVGIKLAASSSRQSKQGKFKDIKDVKAGDLVFFGPPLKIDHVGIVTQNKKGKLIVIHSTNSQGVVEHDINQILYWKKRIKFARDVISP